MKSNSLPEGVHENSVESTKLGFIPDKATNLDLDDGMALAKRLSFNRGSMSGSWEETGEEADEIEIAAKSEFASKMATKSDLRPGMDEDGKR